MGKKEKTKKVKKSSVVVPEIEAEVPVLAPSERHDIIGSDDVDEKITQALGGEVGVKLFRISCAQPNPDSAVINVAWCLNQKTVEILRDNLAVKHPYMLVSVFCKEAGESYIPGDYRLSEYERRLVPLHSGMTQFQFHRPGTFFVIGSIVWAALDDSISKEGALNWLSDLYMKKDIRTGCFERVLHNVWSYAPNTGLPHRLHLPYHDYREIAVRDSFFAKEPPGWLSWYVNLWCDDRPRDQCQFRRRAILAFLFKWIPALIFLVYQECSRFIVVLIALLAGRRGVRYQAFLHPFSWYSGSVWGAFPDMDASAYWWLTDSKARFRPNVLPFLMLPAGWLVYGLVFMFGIYPFIGDFVTKSAGYGGIPIWASLGLFFGGFLALVFILFVCFWIILRAVGIVGAIRRSKRGTAQEQQDRATAEKQRLAEKRKREIEEYYVNRVEPLSCERGGPKVATLKALPESHRTLVLEFLDLKAKVCKPFRLG
ncbi:MAG TPA: hypothetical protein PLV72_03490 [Candidatus Magasanikbacteria bacterium]|mgnify:CR=1 FL=1|nr:hypothetical protein [Candidatus Magasanikbacteria bacterium]